jgi:hypothetical protein
VQRTITRQRINLIGRWGRKGAIFLLCAISACSEPFDPRGPLEKQLVVYSVLSTDRDIQVVRVNTAYMPVGFDPNTYTSDDAVKDARVTLSGAGYVYVLQQTNFPRPDTQRYTTPIWAYALNGFTPQHGKRYDLLVHSPSFGDAAASVVIPGKPLLQFSVASLALLNDPLNHDSSTTIQYTVQLSSLAKGYYARLYIYYDVLKGSRWVEERTEVPISAYEYPKTYSLRLPIYPQLSSTPKSSNVTPQFATGYLQNIIRKLTVDQYKDTHLIYKWIVLVVFQADESLFKYYRSIQGYRDPLSIRLDEPFYSTVQGGVGMVGSYALDSLTYLLPENFNGNR